MVSRKASARAAGAISPMPSASPLRSFQLYVAAFNYLPSQVVRGVHVGFLILMTFGLIGNFTAKSNAGRAAGWLIGSAGFLCGLYQWMFYADLIARDGDPTRLDLAVGTLLAVLIFEGTRRLMGLALPLMCGACILYWFFGQYLPAPFNHRGYDFDQVITHLVLRHRRLLRRADLCLGDLHLPVHPVRLVPRARRDDPAVHRCLARPVRRHPRRSGQGRGVRLGHDGHDLGLRRRQCRHRRPVHDSPDDQVRLSPRLCRRRRGHRVDGRTDHAAGDGRGRLHHGGDAGRRLFRHRQGRGDPGDAVFRLRVLDGASRSRQARPRRHEALGNPERLEGAGDALVSGVAAGGAGLHAVRRLYAALCRQHGAGADGGADPRRQHHARLLLDRAALCVLDRACAGGRRGVAQRPRDRSGRQRRRRAGADHRVHARRPGDAAGLPRFARRQRQVGADRRHGLRHRRHHHRHDDADRRRHHLRQLGHRPRRARACSWRWS